MRILLVEDAESLALFIKKGLKAHNFVVDCVYDGLTAEERALTGIYDLIILDLMLPGKDGVSVCLAVREAGIDTPILMLTARGDLEDRVGGLDAGADDYLLKPFDFDELVARIRALLRRPREKLPEILKVRDIMIDNSRIRVTRGDREIPLSQKEYSVLEMLIRNVNVVLSREEIMDHCWGLTYSTHTNVVDVNINKLRQKLDPAGAQEIIRTVRGSGFVIEE